jgi:hypothetical protein
MKTRSKAVRTNPTDTGTAQRWNDIAAHLNQVRKRVLSEAHIVVATCDLLLRTKINEHLAPTLLLMDEDAASIRQKLIGLLASLPSLRFICLFGDTKQKGPFTLTAKGNVLQPLQTSLCIRQCSSSKTPVYQLFLSLSNTACITVMW